MKKPLLFPVFIFFAAYLSMAFATVCFGFFGTSYPEPENLNTNNSNHQITLLHDGSVKTLPLEDYLYGVVAAEMPATFESEALKAQAVAARTYAVNRCRFPNKDHPDANLCSDSAHCKAYLPPSELEEKFQQQPELLQKIKLSVDNTNGQIAVYQGEPISAVFHSTSSGMTENAKDVWGGDLPYLVSVVSEGEEASPRYTETKEFSKEEFIKKINAGETKVPFSNTPESWFSNWEKNNSGSIKSVNLCGVTFKGTTLRSLLGLRSTHFEITAADSISITTKGNGHGVGMSQYGANDMAKKGYSYEQILKKYYTGITLSHLDDV